MDQPRLGGLLIALSSFGITRLFVAETIRVDMALPFLIAGLAPLLVGLLLTVYGVVLAVGPFSSQYVSTIARWHVTGVAAMAVVFAITGFEQILSTGTIAVGEQTRLLIANVLLGGAVGGTLTGIQSGRFRRREAEVRRSANRALFVNRLLKHEVVNAITIIDGHAELLRESDAGRSVAAIRRAVDRIDSTIEEVGTVARDRPTSAGIDVERMVRDVIKDVRAEYDHAVDLSVRTADSEVAADERIALLVRELLVNAATHGDATSTVTIDGSAHAVELSVSDHGPGLPESQRSLLNEGTFPEYDDPSTGFGLQLVRLLATQFGGDVRVRDTSEEGGTTVTVSLPRSDPAAGGGASIGLSLPALTRAVGAGLLGGVAMGGYFQLTTGLFPVIGSLYGVAIPLVGWLTHLFHSAIFGLLFVTGVTSTRLSRVASGPVRASALGLGWGMVLWLLAAGILMPIWLSIVGVPTSIPNLSRAGFVGHAVWGVVVGATVWWLDGFEM